MTDAIQGVVAVSAPEPVVYTVTHTFVGDVPVDRAVQECVRDLAKFLATCPSSDPDWLTFTCRIREDVPARRHRTVTVSVRDRA